MQKESGEPAVRVSVPDLPGANAIGYRFRRSRLGTAASFIREGDIMVQTQQSPHRSPRETRQWGHISQAEGEALARELASHVDGEVRFDRGSRALYATDSSNYRLLPIGVVLPRSVDDIVATVAACQKYHVPVVSRGGGTGL
ncbi:MAG TPA: FAD-binding protein, partial [Thermomicrobiaceae bacterium]|nr:FAD-binding protein [Thermomicrobiaceae bacterium]